ncbi:hypothetical protein ONS96_014326 [Cadophora gregata f. sp. sojae]|nr:hypothetical protein ONS96_014326 [Cadophora gregata f. sp. sojae]
MASKRSRAPLDRACKKRNPVAQCPGTRVQASAGAQSAPITVENRPAQVFGLEPEIMYMIMSKLDIFTARVGDLLAGNSTKSTRKASRHMPDTQECDINLSK